LDKDCLLQGLSHKDNAGTSTSPPFFTTFKKYFGGITPSTPAVRMTLLEEVKTGTESAELSRVSFREGESGRVGEQAYRQGAGERQGRWRGRSSFAYLQREKKWAEEQQNSTEKEEINGPLVTPSSPASPTAQWMWLRVMIFRPSFSTSKKKGEEGKEKKDQRGEQRKTTRKRDDVPMSGQSFM
jgi:hypothetical protein